MRDWHFNQRMNVGSSTLTLYGECRPTICGSGLNEEAKERSTLDVRSATSPDLRSRNRSPSPNPFHATPWFPGLSLILRATFSSSLFIRRADTRCNCLSIQIASDLLWNFSESTAVPTNSTDALISSHCIFL